MDEGEKQIDAENELNLQNSAFFSLQLRPAFFRDIGGLI